MTDNIFESEDSPSGKKITINGVEYRCSDDAAVIAHALMCVDETLDDAWVQIHKELEQIERTLYSES